jgi:hypothetical protein
MRSPLDVDGVALARFYSRGEGGMTLSSCPALYPLPQIPLFSAAPLERALRLTQSCAKSKGA